MLGHTISLINLPQSQKRTRRHLWHTTASNKAAAASQVLFPENDVNQHRTLLSTNNIDGFLQVSSKSSARSTFIATARLDAAIAARSGDNVNDVAGTLSIFAA